MSRSIKKLWQALLLLPAIALAASAWAGPTQEFWHVNQYRQLPETAPQPAEFRSLILDNEGVADYLRAALDMGVATEIALPEPNGGFTDFLVVDSGTMSPGLQAKYPEIMSFKGMDAQGRRVRLDVSPLGFQAMVFDPQGIWIVRPENFEGTDRYLVFNRTALGMPEGMGVCEVHDEEIDPAGRNLVPQENRPMTETGAVHRTYRAAFAANHWYVAAVGQGTVAGGQAAVVVAVNRLNEVYEYELSVSLQLIPDNDRLIFPADGSNGTDPFGNGTGVINTSTSIINGIIGVANYDIGHVFTTGSGGIAGLGVVCNSTQKARGTTGLGNPIGDGFYIDFVAHEVGHQFRANHSFNSSESSNCGPNRSSAAAYEPGSGTTIMGYAGVCAAGENVQIHSDPYFHAISLQEINAFITNQSTGGSCSADVPNSSQMPVIDPGSLTTGYTIPAQTPFYVHGDATDPDGDALWYSWEQWDRTSSGSTLPQGDLGNNPIFRSFPPKSSGTRTLPAMSTVLGGPAIKGEIMPTTNRSLKFRLTVRDRMDDLHGLGRSVSLSSGTNADATLTVVNSAGPFKVTAPISGTGWGAGETRSVAWDVANTNVAPVSCAAVDIDLSADGGNTWPLILATAVPNTGSADVTVPSVTTTQARVRVSCSSNVFFNVNPANFSITGGAGTYSVGGTVSGLLGSGLSLRLNGGTNLPIAADGTFTFTTPLPDFSGYNVTVATQPYSPVQTCTVANGSGTINGSDVTDVEVTCTTAPPGTFTIGGNVIGLEGSGLKIRLNSGSNMRIDSDGPFAFRGGLADGETYVVTVTSQPDDPVQECVVNNGSGTVNGADVDDIEIDCRGEEEEDDVIFQDGFDGQVFEACQLLQDPSFEATDPGTYENPFWDSTSDNYGDALCETSGCDNLPARTGDWFAYFGGFGIEDLPESGSVSQQVTIPAGSNYELNFWMNVPFVIAPYADTVTVKVDGTTIWTYTEPDTPEQLSEYALHTVDMSAYADDVSHIIRIEYNHPDDGVMSDVMVDDVTLDCVR